MISLRYGFHTAAERGATLVEFAIAMVYIFFFMAAFSQIVMIMVAHERTTYAAYTGTRVNAVGGNVNRAVSDVNGGRVSVRGNSVKVSETLDLPIDFNNIYKKGGGRFVTSAKFTMPKEPSDRGDNGL
jgi:hypothetical protein